MYDFDLIETPENVELQRRLAGIGSRFLAGLLDSLIILAGVIILAVVLVVLARTEVLLGPDVGWWALAILVLLFFLLFWGYFAFFEMRTNGQSPGKKVMKIRVVKEGGGAITFVDVAIRNLIRVVDFLPGTYGVAGVVMFLTGKCQRLGDLAAGTVVVSEGTGDYSAHSDSTVKAEWDRQASSEALRATGLTPQEYRLVYNYYMRRNQLTFPARLRVLPRILTPILRRNGQTLMDPALDVMENYVDQVVSKAYFAEQQAGQARTSGQTEGPR